MTEFTGERVIPGQVDDDLWAEHIARYAFVSRFASGKRVLDLGCGSGYGTAELARHARSAIGIDVAPEAIDYASRQFPGVEFRQASATALPFSDAEFDLVVAFEVIEHLEDWRALLAEAQRVLDRSGLFIVSTPNKIYYAESRDQTGPNPYHQHEFEFAEFQNALAEFFPHTTILLQDRLESFAFYPAATEVQADAQIARSSAAPTASNFFVAVCSPSPLPDLRAFLYVPSASNLLREREHHIRLLKSELAQVKTWLDQTSADQARAATLIAELNEENRRKTQWAIDTEQRLTADLHAQIAELAKAVRFLDQAEATIVERTEWAQRLDAQVQKLAARINAARESRWLKLGRRIGLGPDLEGE